MIFHQFLYLTSTMNHVFWIAFTIFFVFWKTLKWMISCEHDLKFTFFLIIRNMFWTNFDKKWFFWSNVTHVIQYTKIDNNDQTIVNNTSLRENRNECKTTFNFRRWWKILTFVTKILLHWSIWSIAYNSMKKFLIFSNDKKRKWKSYANKS